MSAVTVHMPTRTVWAFPHGHVQLVCRKLQTSQITQLAGGAASIPKCGGYNLAQLSSYEVLMLQSQVGRLQLDRIFKFGGDVGTIVNLAKSQLGRLFEMDGCCWLNFQKGNCQRF